MLTKLDERGCFCRETSPPYAVTYLRSRSQDVRSPPSRGAICVYCKNGGAISLEGMLS